MDGVIGYLAGVVCTLASLEWLRVYLEKGRPPLRNSHPYRADDTLAEVSRLRMEADRSRKRFLVCVGALVLSLLLLATLSGCLDYESLSSGLGSDAGDLAPGDAAGVSDLDGDLGSKGDLLPLPDLSPDLLPPPDLCQPTTHDDGRGQSWIDCVPAVTYSLAEATAACEAFRAAFSLASTCTLNTSACQGDVVALDFGGATNCGAWQFTGSMAGKVSTPSQTCFCPDSSSPSWN